jgi:hypothetical protein
LRIIIFLLNLLLNNLFSKTRIAVRGFKKSVPIAGQDRFSLDAQQPDCPRPKQDCTRVPRIAFAAVATYSVSIPDFPRCWFPQLFLLPQLSLLPFDLYLPRALQVTEVLPQQVSLESLPPAPVHLLALS